MSLDLRAIARALDANCLPHGVADSTHVDGVSELDELVVIGDPRFTTLITARVPQLLRRIEEATEDELTVLRSAAFVTTDDGEELREQLQVTGLTALVAASGPQTSLHSRLQTILASEQAASDRQVAAAMKILTQVARRGGTSAVIVELARQIDGWAVLLDTHGQLIASAGAGRLHVDDAAAVALGRPVRVRSRSLQLHQVGTDRDLAAYLVIDSRAAQMSLARDLGQQAAALCDLLLRSHDPSVTSNLGREALLDTLTLGGSSADDLLRRWGVHETSLTGFALASKSRNIDLDRLVTRWFDELGAEHVFATKRGHLYGFVRDDLPAELEQRVLAYTPLGSSGVNLGIGEPAPTTALDRSLVQARQALRSAFEADLSVMRYTELPTVDTVFKALPREAFEQIASVLDSLRDGSGKHGQLTETLRVFLAEHGGHRASARQLGVHRQTLVSRIRHIEALTGLSMSRADDRAAAWLALRALGK